MNLFGDVTGTVDIVISIEEFAPLEEMYEFVEVQVFIFGLLFFLDDFLLVLEPVTFLFLLQRQIF
jgi:hypothetical protein